MKRQYPYRLASALVLLFCLIVGVSAFASAEPVTLKVGLRFEPERWSDLIDQFHAQHPDIRIETIMQVDWNMDRVVLNHLSGEPFDVIYTVIEQAWAMVDQGLIMPLDSFIAQDKSDELRDFLEDVHPTLLQIWQKEGSQYYLPFEWNNMVMYYNTSLYDERGLDAPDSNWTWDDFLQNAKRLTFDRAGDGVNDVYGYAGAWPGPFGLAPWIYTAGGRILNDDFTASRLNEPAAVEAVDFVRSLTWEHNVVPREGEYADTQNQLGMWGSGRWSVAHYQNVEFHNYNIQLWPKNRDQTTVLGGGAHGISSITRHPEAAWTFIKWLNSQDVVYHWTAMGDSNPSRQSVALTDAVLGLPPANAHLYYEALNNILPVPSPPQFPELDRLMIERIGAIFWENAESPGTALEELDRLLDALLQDGSTN